MFLVLDNTQKFRYMETYSYICMWINCNETKKNISYIDSWNNQKG